MPKRCWCGVFALVLVAGCKGKGNGSQVNATVVQDVQLSELLGDYKGNEVRADGKYKGKRVRVTGVVGDVKKDITDTIYVTLGTGSELEIPVVQCFVPSKLAQQAAALDKGATVTMTGEVSGLMMNVLVKDCEIGAVAPAAPKPAAALPPSVIGPMACAKLLAEPAVVSKCEPHGEEGYVFEGPGTKGIMLVPEKPEDPEKRASVLEKMAASKPAGMTCVSSKGVLLQFMKAPKPAQRDEACKRLASL